MPYGTIKVDNITFTDGGVDKSVAISGLVQNPTFTGNVTVTGTVSGATVRATTVSGVTISGTTINAASGVFTTQISGAVVVAPAGLVGTPSVQVGTGATVAPGLYGAGTDQLGVSTGGSSRLIIDSVGQIRVVTLGSAAAPALVVGNDVNTGIYSPGADQVAISTNGLGRLFIDSSGNVGIGTAPSTLLHVAGAARIGANDSSDAVLEIGVGATGNRSAYIDFVGDTTYSDYGLRLIRGYTGANSISMLTHRGTGTLYINCEENADLAFGTNSTLRAYFSGTTFKLANATDIRANINTANITLFGGDGTGANIELFGGSHASYANLMVLDAGEHRIRSQDGTSERVRIDSSGRLLVGTSTYVQGNTYTTGNLLNVSGGSGVGPQLSTYSADAFALGIDFSKSRSASVGTGTIVQSGDALGNILFNGHDGTGYKQAATITAVVDGTPGYNDMPGRLVFSTTDDGASSPTERMRITNGGDVRIGTAAALDVGSGTDDGFRFLAPGTAAGIFQCSNNDAVGYFRRRSSDGIMLSFRRDTTQVGTISVTTTATAYNTSSDYRLKENVTAVTDGIARLQQLKPSRFNFIADPTKTVDGFLAHEVQSVVPEAITGEKDAVNDDGNPVYQGIDQSKLVPLVVAALQEALERINLLEAKVASLEAK